MDSQNVPHGEEALACLVQAALKARVNEQEPSPCLWKRIRLVILASTVSGTTKTSTVSSEAG